MNHTKIINDDTKKPFEYSIIVSGPGAEMTVGTVPQSFSDYWKGKSNKALARYMFADPEYRRFIPGLGAYETEEWHSYDDVVHAYGPYLLGRWCNFEVFDHSAKDYLINEIAFNDVDGVDVVHQADIDTKIVTGGACLVKNQTHEEVGFKYGLRLDSPFNRNLLKVSEVTIDELTFFHSIFYNDNELEIEDIYSRHDGHLTSKIVRRK